MMLEEVAGKLLMPRNISSKYGSEPGVG